MGCCNSTEAAIARKRDVLLISAEDGAVTRTSFKDASTNPFVGTSAAFRSDAGLKSGPLVVFATPKQSAVGLKPIKDTSVLRTALAGSAAYHGGEQLLYAAICSLQIADATDKKLATTGTERTLILSSYGRLFAIKGKDASLTLHVTQLASAQLSGERLALSFEAGARSDWVVSGPEQALAELQVMVWVLHCTAHTQLLMQVNIPKPPIELLPPLSVDGNLHTCFSIWANAGMLAEPEDVLHKPEPLTRPALLLIRQWAALREVDVTEWKGEALRPVAMALAHNDAMLAFKAKDAPWLGAHIDALGPMLATNRRLLTLTLDNVGGEPRGYAKLCAGLAANDASFLSVINISRVEIGDAGAAQLVEALKRLRPGLLAELHLTRSRLSAVAMHNILNALHAQRNLLQLHLGSNSLGADGAGALPSQALAALLSATKGLELLDVSDSAAQLEAFATLPEGSLRKLSTLNLSKIGWSQAMLTLIASCGALRVLNLSGGAGSLAAGQLQPFFSALLSLTARFPSLQLELSSEHGLLASALTELLPALAGAGVPSGFVLRGSGLSDHLLIVLLQQLAQVAGAAADRPGAAEFKSLSLDKNLTAAHGAIPAAADAEALLELDAAGGGNFAASVSALVLSAVSAGQPPNAGAIGPVLAEHASAPSFADRQTAASTASIQVVVPANSFPGQQLQVNSPYGGSLLVTVPPNAPPGARLTVAVPRNTASSVTTRGSAQGPSGNGLAALLASPAERQIAFAYRVTVCEALTALLAPHAADKLTRLSLAGNASAASARSRVPSSTLAFGPLLGLFFRSGLAYNKSLEFLDVSGNALGDAGIAALGRALKTNRTLTALRIDNNGAGADGLKELKIALNGNKKVVDMPIPDDDVSAVMESLSEAYKKSLRDELAARQTVKSSYRKGGYCDEGRKRQGLDNLKAAKVAQARARVAKDKVRNVIAALQANLLRNQKVAAIKGAGKEVRGQRKLAEQANKAAAKAEAKARAKRESQKVKLWQRRHALMTSWRNHIKKVGKEQGVPTAWFTEWLRKWGKPYLNPAGMRSLWIAVPDDQRLLHDPMKEAAEDVFAQEEDMDASVEALMQEARFRRSEALFHSQEIKYFDHLAASDPTAVGKPPVDPGIQTHTPPGQHQPGQFGTGHYTNWDARYRYITGDLQKAIQKPAPADYQWQPVGAVKADANIGVRPPPMITYPKPKPIPEGVVLGRPVDQPALQGPVANPVASGVPVGTPLGAATATPPIAEPLGQPVAQPVAVQAYPVLPVAESVYEPPPAPPPAPRFGGASSSQQATQTMLVTIPPGVIAGQQMQVTNPNGGTFLVSVPPGVRAGEQISVQVPVPVQAAVPFSAPPTKNYYYRSRLDDDYLLYGFGGLGMYYWYSSYHYNYYYFADRPVEYHHHQHEHYDEAAAVTEGADVAAAAADLGDVGTADLGEGIDEGVEDVAEFDAVGDAYGEEPPFESELTGLDDEDAGAETDEADADADGDADVAAAEADGEALDMYGSAGPHDLPDAGAGPGDPSDAVGAGRRARRMAWRAACGDRCRVEAAPRDLELIGRRAREAAERRAAAKAHAKAALSPLLRGFDESWERLTLQAEADVLGSFEAPRFVAKTDALVPTRRPSAAVTLVTQCSMDRLQRLATQLTAWSGPAAVAIFVDEAAASEAARAAEACALLQLSELPPESLRQLSVSFLFRPDVHGSTDGGSPLYPINALRNLALDAARTDLVFLLDVDFVPSAGLLRALHRNPHVLHAAAGCRVALVLPAFEVADTAPMPRAMAPLTDLCRSSPPATSAFHVGHFPAGHAPTDYARWFAAARPYEVAYSEYFEPYIIASRRWLPRYDERFCGYGMNKVSHIYAVAASGARFLVLPEHFVAAHEHPKSPSWSLTFGSNADPAHRMRVAVTYARMKRELPPLPAVGQLEPGSLRLCWQPEAPLLTVGERCGRCDGEAREGEGSSSTQLQLGVVSQQKLLRVA